MSSPRSKPTVGDAPAATRGSAAVAVRVQRGAHLEAGSDRVAEEVPVALVYNGAPHVVMMATPGDLEDFARGFSLTEEIVASIEEIEDLRVAPIDSGVGQGFEISLRIPEARHQALAQRTRNLQGRTGCGLCGAASIDEAIRPPRRVPAGVSVAAGAIRRALETMRREQPINQATGATHAAAWATPDGLIVALREDVGRHNALDKLVGHLLGRGTDLARGFLVITSRASYEMVLKSTIAGIPMLVAISAPTAYAVRIAEEAGLTLIGFAQSERQVVYTCPGRLSAAASPSASAA